MSTHWTRGAREIGQVIDRPGEQYVVVVTDGEERYAICTRQQGAIYNPRDTVFQWSAVMASKDQLRSMAFDILDATGGRQ